jgi:leader peptidase (prepilin peptidase) / N-methyltransferase
MTQRPCGARGCSAWRWQVRANLAEASGDIPRIRVGYAFKLMPTVTQDVGRRIAIGSDGWTWPAGLVVLYAMPALALWRGNAPDAPVLFASLALAAALIALSEFDRRTFRLPDLITIPLALCGLLLAAIMGKGVIWHLVSAGLGLALILLVDLGYRAWRRRRGIGFGDAKLLAASGAWLGAEALPTVLLWACVSALGVLLLMHVSDRQVGARTAIPFGSFLAFGTWLVWCLGPLQ